MLKASLTSILLFFCFNSFAQLTLQQKLQTDIPLNTQFQLLLSQSRSQDADFKIIRKSNIEIIQRNVNDSIARYTKEITALKKNSSSSSQQVEILQDSVEALSQSLAEEQKKTDSISFLGNNFSKSAYHTMVWSIIIVLAILSFALLTVYRKAKVDAVEHQKTVDELQNEFQAYKKKAMETEQKLKRQLLDEQLKRDS